MTKNEYNPSDEQKNPVINYQIIHYHTLLIEYTHSLLKTSSPGIDRITKLVASKVAEPFVHLHLIYLK